MRVSGLLVQLALWTSTTYAFFPYTPVWKEEEEQAAAASKKFVGLREGKRFSADVRRKDSRINIGTSSQAARDAARLSRRYRYSQQSSATSVVRRDNAYNIMEADDSSKSMTAGIDQDGTDYSYFLQVQMGSKGKELYMLLDTGAGSSWLMGSDCTSSACTMHDTFGSGDSDTLEASSDDFTVSYGSGKVTGTLATDTISLAGMSFKYEFGLASETSDDFTHFAFDGILGLSMTDGANDNFLQTLNEANKIDANIFAVSLNRAADGTNAGEITFGSTDSDKYTGDIVYTAIGTESDWAIPMDDISYDGKTAGIGGLLSYIDTGTSFVFGPSDAVKKLHDLVPGAKSSDGTSYGVPCDSDKTLTFTFSGTEYAVSPKDWVSPKNTDGQCTSNIYGYEVVDGAWLLGDTFLKNVYTVFDADKKQVGFASLAVSDSSSSESVTTSSSTVTSTATATVSSTATTTETMTPLPDTASAMASMGLHGHETEAAASTTTSDAAQGTESNEESAGSFQFHLGGSLGIGLICSAFVTILQL